MLDLSKEDRIVAFTKVLQELARALPQLLPDDYVQLIKYGDLHTNSVLPES